MSQSNPPPNDEEPAADVSAFAVRSHLIDNVPVRLEAYLGCALLTVAELAALDTGSVVALDASLNQAVELRLNGVAVARGELVSVGDRFAVRLLEIST